MGAWVGVCSTPITSPPGLHCPAPGPGGGDPDAAPHRALRRRPPPHRRPRPRIPRRRRGRPPGHHDHVDGVMGGAQHSNDGTVRGNFYWKILISWEWFTSFLKDWRRRMAVSDSVLSESWSGLLIFIPSRLKICPEFNAPQLYSHSFIPSLFLTLFWKPNQLHKTNGAVDWTPPPLGSIVASPQAHRQQTGGGDYWCAE